MDTKHSQGIFSIFYEGEWRYFGRDARVKCEFLHKKEGFPVLMKIEDWDNPGSDVDGYEFSTGCESKDVPL